MGTIADDIRSSNENSVTAALARLHAQLESVFVEGNWKVEDHIERWTGENKDSLWKHDVKAKHKAVLEDLGGESSWREWLGDVHYASATVTARRLFRDGSVRDNTGWRLTYMALPAPRVFISGLAHHYQGRPAQNLLGNASNFLYDLLESQLGRKQEVDRSVLGRKIQPADWDGEGLTDAEITINGKKWPGRMPLVLARNTTTKKILSTFISVSAVPPGTTDESLRAEQERYLALMNWMVGG